MLTLYLQIGLKKMNYIEHRYCTSIYPAKVIQKAITAYTQIAKISSRSDGDYTICAFSCTLIDASLVANEFDNYLIELLNSQEAK